VSTGPGIRKGMARAFLLLCLLIGTLALLSAQRAAASGGWWSGAWMQAGVRVVAVVVALLLWFKTQALIGARRVEGGIGDALHDCSASWNGWLHAHPATANWILRISSGFIDVFGLFLLGAGLLGPTLRPFIALLFLFVFRQLCQALCALPAPQGMIWRHPGFPSLLVTYGVAGDFFISGHTAIAVLGAIEMARLLPWWVAAIAGLVAAGEAVMVIVLRAHYTMDVLGAIVAAWCAADLAARLCMLLGI